MYINILYFAEYAVAPLVGAWIETNLPLDYFTGVLVAPLVGAWIETPAIGARESNYESHPSWVRGLKHKSRFIGGSDATSHPSWVRGLKHQYHLTK